MCECVDQGVVKTSLGHCAVQLDAVWSYQAAGLLV